MQHQLAGEIAVFFESVAGEAVLDSNLRDVRASRYLPPSPAQEPDVSDQYCRPAFGSIAPIRLSSLPGDRAAANGENAMNITLQQRAGVDIAHLDGEFRDEAGDELSATIGGLLGENGRRIVLDMSRVNYLNSTGLSALVSLAAKVHLNESRIVLAAPTPFVANVLDLTKLSRFFEVTKSVDEAVGKLA